MAKNFLTVSPSYADRVSEKARRLDAAVVVHLDDSYRLSRGQATSVRAALKRAGYPLTKAKLEAVIRRFRIPFLMLNNKATRSMRITAQKGHALAEGWACLVADGLTTWRKVERAMSAATPTRKASVNHDAPVFEGNGVVVLTQARYKHLARIEEAVTRLRDHLGGVTSTRGKSTA